MNIHNCSTRAAATVLLLTFCAHPLPASAQGMAFTYQGRLDDGPNPAQGIYDLRFTIYDAPAGGSLVAGALTSAATGVTNGLFTVTLDFGAGVFDGSNRWLEIAVKTNGPATFITLSPRQPLTPTPYAMCAANLAGSLPTDQLTGTLGSAQLAGTYSSPLTMNNGANTFSGTFLGDFYGLNFIGGQFSGTYFGNGAGLYGLNASQLASGSVPESRLSPSMAWLDRNQTFTATNIFSGVSILTNDASRFAGAFTGDGAGLTNLNAAAMASGTLPSSQFTGTYSSPVTLNNDANQFTGTFAGDGSGLTNLALTSLAGLYASNFWQTGGNSGIGSANFLGTTDNQPLQFRVNGYRALRLEFGGDSSDPGSEPDGAPNLIGGAMNNSVAAGVVGAVIAGGGATNYGGSVYVHSVQSDFGAIGGGGNNSISTQANFCVIAGGFNNRVNGNSGYSTIAGGTDNRVGVNCASTVIIGGANNTISTWSPSTLIGGGAANDIDRYCQYSLVAGGYENNIGYNSPYAVIAGGRLSDIGTNSGLSFIGAGHDNNISNYSENVVIVGGVANNVGTNSDNGSIGGGFANAIADNSMYATIGGGNANTIGTNSTYSTIAGGANHVIGANSRAGIIAGGANHKIGTNCWYGFIGGGYGNTTTSNANYATLPGGYMNAATNYAFAAGTSAKALHTGAFVWADSTGMDLASTNADSVTMRGSGGFRLFSNFGATAGVYLAPGGGSWTSLSDRNAKENFTAIDPAEVLARVVALPVAAWNYKSQGAAIRHLGPTAQDFKAAFGLGESDTGITTIDADGVALAAIQALNQKLEQKETEIADLKNRLELLEQVLARQAPD